MLGLISLIIIFVKAATLLLGSNGIVNFSIEFAYKNALVPIDLHVEGIVEDNSPKENKPAKPKKKKAIARKDMTMAQWTWHEMKRNKVAYLMILPFMLVFLLFTVFPVGLSLVLSFTNFNMLSFSWDMFIGIDNNLR